MEVFDQALRVAEGIERVDLSGQKGIEGDCGRDGEGRDV
jgi:hypothetical protein